MFVYRRRIGRDKRGIDLSLLYHRGVLSQIGVLRKGVLNKGVPIEITFFMQAFQKNYGVLTKLASYPRGVLSQTDCSKSSNKLIYTSRGGTRVVAKIRSWTQWNLHCKVDGMGRNSGPRRMRPP